MSAHKVFKDLESLDFTLCLANLEIEKLMVDRGITRKRTRQNESGRLVGEA